MDAIGVADRNTLAGVVRMHSAAKGAGLRPLIGCRLDLVDAPSLLAYPHRPRGLWPAVAAASLGKMRATKGECDLTLADVARASARASPSSPWPGEDLDAFEARAAAAASRRCPELRHVAAAHLYRGDDLARIERLDRMAQAPMAARILATNDVHYHAPDRRPLQDVMSCIREKVTLANAGYLLNPNAERHLKSPAEMTRLFERWPHAIAATREFADALDFSLDELRYEYPRETRARGAHAAAASRASDLGRRDAALARRRVRPRSTSSCATSSR